MGWCPNSDAASSSSTSLGKYHVRNKAKVEMIKHTTFGKMMYTSANISPHSIHSTPETSPQTRMATGNDFEHLVLNTSGTVVTRETAETMEHVEETKPTSNSALPVGRKHVEIICPSKHAAMNLKYFQVFSRFARLWQFDM
mmetsp:Transcript_117/g.400  ORF Transcript_117/g.400 Transcript_117/m.400 type:complete len:141 (+) Transcript_117:509-931(+)